MSTDSREKNVRLGIVIIALATLVYSVLIAGQVVAWFGIAILLVVLYFAWRLIRAVERIARALEE